MESIFDVYDLVESKVEDPEMLAKLYCEDIATVNKYLDVLKQNEDLKISHKLTKKSIKKLKQEFWALKNCPCKAKALTSKRKVTETSLAINQP